MIGRVLRSMLAPSGTPDAEAEPDAAAAALLIEAAHSDGAFDPQEKAAILRILKERLGVKAPEAAFAAGLELQRHAVDLFRFLRPIKAAYGRPERLALIEALWEVIYADGKRDRHEESVVRRLLPLLGLTDQESGTARKRVLGRLGSDV